MTNEDAWGIAVRDLYNELEEIGRDHDEFYDTDVRESLHHALTHLFIWGNQPSSYPIAFEMFTPEGDAAVAAAIEKFVETSKKLLSVQPVAKGQPRLDLLQNAELVTPEGRQFDEFIGHGNHPLDDLPLPDRFFSPDYD